MTDTERNEIINLVSDTPEEAQRIREWSDANAGGIRLLAWCPRCSFGGYPWHGDDIQWTDEDRVCPACGWGE